MKKKLLQRTTWGLLLGSLLSVVTVDAQYVRVAPPPSVAERPPAAHGPGYAWVPGYQRWDGHSYQWTNGRWVQPPRRGATWFPGRWDRTPQGWHWMPGHWRG